MRLGLNTHFPKIQKNEYFLSNIAVNEKMRGKGFGKELMRHFETSAYEKNCAYCSLFVEVDNENAISFYQRLGYEEKEEKLLGEKYTRKNLAGFTKMVKKITS